MLGSCLGSPSWSYLSRSLSSPVCLCIGWVDRPGRLSSVWVRTPQLDHRNLYAALIEYRSVERFRLLSEELEDQELADFYHKLMVSEANHYTMFLGFARQYGDRKEVDEKWRDLLNFEAQVMQKLSKNESIHG